MCTFLDIWHNTIDTFLFTIFAKFDLITPCVSYNYFNLLNVKIICPWCYVTCLLYILFIALYSFKYMIWSTTHTTIIRSKSPAWPVYFSTRVGDKWREINRQRIWCLVWNRKSHSSDKRIWLAVSKRYRLESVHMTMWFIDDYWQFSFR